jgi:hypothetical protein
VNVLFAGPSLAGMETSGVVNRGPAQQGDVTKAVLDGATAIGLVDGVFEHRSTVWHKEILFALSEGVTVLGAASMGALRAAECAAFGMIGIGRVFELFVSNILRDDDAVAQLHAPEELDYSPLTEALVNISATLDDFQERSLITDAEYRALSQAAQRLFFKERTYRAVVAASMMTSERRKEELTGALESQRVDLKRRDALELLSVLRALPAERGPRPNWEFASTQMFQAIKSRVQPSP